MKDWETDGEEGIILGPRRPLARLHPGGADPELLNA